MTRRGRWLTGVFLVLTASAIGWELVAAFDGSPDTWPWTDLVATYVPWPITAVAIGVLVAWLPVHFWRAYRSRRKR